MAGVAWRGGDAALGGATLPTDPVGWALWRYIVERRPTRGGLHLQAQHSVDTVWILVVMQNHNQLGTRMTLPLHMTVLIGMSLHEFA